MEGKIKRGKPPSPLGTVFLSGSRSSAWPAPRNLCPGIFITRLLAGFAIVVFIQSFLLVVKPTFISLSANLARLFLAFFCLRLVDENGQDLFLFLDDITELEDGASRVNSTCVSMSRDFFSY